MKPTDLLADLWTVPKGLTWCDECGHGHRRPRACPVCCGCMSGKYGNAKTCKPACRQKAYRQRRKSEHMH